MRALTVKPIWAGLIEAGLKTIEVRSRNTPLPGAPVICTSRRATGARDDPTVPRGVTLCIVDLVDSRPMTKEDEADAGVECRPGAWAWVIRNARPLRRIPVTERLGLFNLQRRSACSKC